MAGASMEPSRSIRGRYPRAPNMTDRTRTAKGTSTHPSDGWRTASVSIRLAGVARIRRVPVMELEAAEEAERVEGLKRSKPRRVRARKLSAPSSARSARSPSR